MHALARLHRRPVLVTEEMEQPVDERPAPLLADHLRAEDDVTERSRLPVRQRRRAVDRERQDVRRLVDAEVLPLECTHLGRADERDPELAVRHPFGRAHVAGERDRTFVVHGDAASVRDLDLEHQRCRAEPVSSACRLYASTIRCTSLCRTTSSWPNSTKPMPSSERRMSRTWISPEACSRGRSTCVTSPVTTILEPNPSRVRNICICSGVVFCASSRITNESFRVRPRMKASGATSIVPRSMYAFSRSASIVSSSASNRG